MNWYCITHNIQRGPMTLDAMRALITSGSLTPDTYVWTPSFGADWRAAGNVAELFPSLAAPTTPPPLDGATEHAPRVLLALAHARVRMFSLLFNPFSLGTWLRYFFFIMMARMSPLSDLGGRLMQLQQPDQANATVVPATQLLHLAAQRLVTKYDTFLAAPFSEQLSTGALALLVPILSVAVSLYISSWGVFLFLHGWHNPRARLQESFLNSRYYIAGYLKWKFLYTIPLLLIFLTGIAYIFTTIILPFGRGQPLPTPTLATQLATLATLASIFLLAFINFLTDQFIAPILFWRNPDIPRAFALLWRCISSHPLTFLRFLLAYFIFMLAASFFFVVLLPAGQTNASLPVLFLLPILFVPFFTLLRGFALFYLVQWRSDLTQNK